jgi:hypothetical protein|uniref:Uncharacterized protein n=1 Tax=CrAss-like virus sp. ctZ6R2 TaxID=2827629 RepID=A0A8S5RT22_9CAUD|nr:MAG TPA: hypothetical protein [CrAss-like virus sp. ctZ6R2]
MANFSFVSGAKFRPFSYQEMLQPLQAYTQEYNTIQEGMGELGTKADVFERMANEQTDPQAYAIYKQYSNDLAAQAESLAKQGLTPASRQGLIDMKRRYSSEIVPIEQAYKRRQELIDEQRKLQAQDSTLLFDRPASTLSLDELIANPALSPQSYSGALLSKQVGTAAQNLAKEVRENPRKWRTILGNQYYETIMQKGFRPEEIMQAVQNNPEASPILQGIVEDAVGSSGIRSWGDENILNRAYDYARQGLWNAVGETQYQTLSNKAYDYAMQERLAAARKGKTEGTPSAVFRSVPKTKVDGDKKTTELNNDLQFIQQLRANPSMINEEVERFNPGYPTQYGVNVGSGIYKVKPHAERLQQIIKKYDMKDGNMDQLEQKLQADIRSSAVRDFIYKPNITQSDLISQVIKENARTLGAATESTGLYELDDNRKGDPIKLKNISDYFTGDNDISYDPEVGLIINATKDGKTKSAVIDPELIDDADRNVANIMHNINTYLEYGYDQQAQAEINNMMNYIYGKFNTLAKRQSNTDSKLE